MRIFLSSLAKIKEITYVMLKNYADNYGKNIKNPVCPTVPDIYCAKLLNSDIFKYFVR